MGQTPRSRSQGKNNGTHGTVLSQGIFMWNIKALPFTVQKLLAWLKIQRGGQNDRMTESHNDRMTDRTKTICPAIFDLGGIKRFKLLKIFIDFYKKKNVNSTIID